MALISDLMAFFSSTSRFMQRRNYKRLDGGRKRWKAVRLGGDKGKTAWKIKLLPKIRMSFRKSTVKLSVNSWLVKLQDRYVDLTSNLARKRVRQPSAGKRIEDFNDKLIVEMYKSFGIDVKRLR